MKQLSLAPCIAVVLLSLVKADTIQVGSISYNGKLEFKNDAFWLTTKKHGVLKFSAGDSARELLIFFNGKGDGVHESHKTSNVRGAFHEGLPQVITPDNHDSLSEADVNQTHITPKKCFIRFKKVKPSLHAVLLSIENDTVRVQEDTSDGDHTTKSAKKQTATEPLSFLKTEISSMQCRE
jgi:hypothetical protein